MRLKHGVKPDNLSVTDQPGWTLTLVGIFISFLLGYSLKSFLSPDRLKLALESAASRIHKDFDFKIGTAEVSLSNYGIPRFAVVARDVRIIARHPCLADSVIDVDRIEIPVEFFSALNGSPEIQELSIGQVEWRIPRINLHCQDPAPEVKQTEVKQNIEPALRRGQRSDRQKSSKNEIATTSKEVLKSPMPVSGPKVSAEQGESSSKINRVEVSSLRLILTEYPQIPVEARNVVFQVLSNHPLKVKIKAGLELFRDSKLADFLTHSKVIIDYDETESVKLAASIVGHVREGSYAFHSQFDLKSKFVNLESQVQHFPVMELYPFVAETEIAKRIKDNKQLWLSAKFSLKSELEKIKGMPLIFTDMRLEGEALEFFADRFDILNFSPFKAAPFQVQIQKLSLDRLNEMLVQPLKQKSIGSFGNFKGALVVREGNELNLAGELSGLEFIFSNKGERQNQKFQKLSLDLKREPTGMVRVNINRLEPEAGALSGDVNMTYDPNSMTSNLDVSLEEMKLNPAVIDLMTDGGRLEGARGRVQIKMNKERVESVRGKVNVDEFEIEGFSGKKALLEISPEAAKTKMKILAQDVLWTRGSDDQWFFNSMHWQEEMKFKTAKIELKTADFSALEWVRSTLQSEDAKTKIISSGSWDQIGQLRGTLRFEHDRKIENFQMTGTREKPILQGSE